MCSSSPMGPEPPFISTSVLAVMAGVVGTSTTLARRTPRSTGLRALFADSGRGPTDGRSPVRGCAFDSLLEPREGGAHAVLELVGVRGHPTERHRGVRVAQPGEPARDRSAQA